MFDDDGMREALTLIRAVDDEQYRADAVRGIAPHLPTHLFPGVVDAIALPDPRQRADTLAALLPHAPADLRTPITTAARDAADLIDRASTRAARLLTLAAAQHPDERPTTVRRAFNAILAMPAQANRHELLAGSPAYYRRRHPRAEDDADPAAR